MALVPELFASADSCCKARDVDSDTRRLERESFPDMAVSYYSPIVLQIIIALS